MFINLIALGWWFVGVSLFVMICVVFSVWSNVCLGCVVCGLLYLVVGVVIVRFGWLCDCGLVSDNSVVIFCFVFICDLFIVIDCLLIVCCLDWFDLIGLL